jgi:hypothetical protein
MLNLSRVHEPAGSGLSTGSGNSAGSGTASSAFPEFVSHSGSSASTGSLDLSKTNELLQQLLDAVRKQRGASLPPGGLPVYPDR